MNCYKKLIKTLEVTENENNIVYTICPNVTLTNLAEYNLVFCQTKPSTSDTKKVFLKSNGTTYKMLGIKGNFLRADQIKTRTVYPVVFGDDNGHFSLMTSVPCSAYTAQEEKSELQELLKD